MPTVRHNTRSPDDASSSEAPTACSPAMTSANEVANPEIAATTPAVMGWKMCWLSELRGLFVTHGAARHDGGGRVVDHGLLRHDHARDILAGGHLEHDRSEHLFHDGAKPA